MKRQRDPPQYWALKKIIRARPLTWCPSKLAHGYAPVVSYRLLDEDVPARDKVGRRVAESASGQRLEGNTGTQTGQGLQLQFRLIIIS